jgi:hypothetical protein
VFQQGREERERLAGIAGQGPVGGGEVRGPGSDDLVDAEMKLCVQVVDEGQGAAEADRVRVSLYDVSFAILLGSPGISLVDPVLARMLVQPLINPGTVVVVVPGLKPHDAGVLGKALTAAVAGVPFSTGQRHEDFDPLVHENHLDAPGGGGVAGDVLRVQVDRIAIGVIVRARIARGGSGQVQVHLLPIAGPELAAGRSEPPGRNRELVLDHRQQRVGVRDDDRLVGEGAFVLHLEVGGEAFSEADISQPIVR